MIEGDPVEVWQEMPIPELDPRTRTREAWLALFADADVCLTTVHTPEEASRDPHRMARPTPGAARRPAPELGQHTEEILLELGYDWERIAQLKETGAVP